MISAYHLLLIPALVFLRIFISLGLSNFEAKGVSWTGEATKWPHTLLRMKDNDINKLATTTPLSYEDFNKTLDAILISRVPGTQGHETVRKFIVSEMQSLGWVVEEDSFSDVTPYGRKPFSNIIATVNPYACRRLVIACHYDSMYNREFTFLGATDSAVPCAMMINAAKVLNSQLSEQKKDNQLTLQYIFFDGEEAFRKWSSRDSLYGSRHLAENWNKMAPFPNGLNDGKHCVDKDYASYLDRMEVMVLLDLIGMGNPRFYSYFPETHGLYMQLAGIEQRLNSKKLLDAPGSSTNYFRNQFSMGLVEDDHIPFMRKGVPILHLIPSPFPKVWHRESDNRRSLDHSTIDNLNKILRVFIAEYLHLGSIESRQIM